MDQWAADNVGELVQLCGHCHDVDPGPDPDAPRPFRTPLVPLVPILAVVVCGAMIAGLGKENWARLGVWLAIGLVIYFAYGVRHSRVQLTRQ